MGRIAIMAVALVLAVAGTGAAAGLGATASAVKATHASVVGEDGAYNQVAALVSAVPEHAPLPPEAEAPTRTALASLVEAAGVPCRAMEHVLRGADEHPAYTVVTALCDCDHGRGQLVNVMLFKTGRAAVLPLGEVTVEEAADGLRYYAF